MNVLFRFGVVLMLGSLLFLAYQIVDTTIQMTHSSQVNLAE